MSEHLHEPELVPTSVRKYAERYKKPRVFVRAVESERYTLTEQQRAETGSNRLFKKLGYQRVVDLEYAPEWAARNGVTVDTPHTD